MTAGVYSGRNLRNEVVTRTRALRQPTQWPGDSGPATNGRSDHHGDDSSRSSHDHHGVHLERRSVPGGALFQMKLVHGPHVPLPPFGRRADDIRPLPHSHLVVRRALDIVVASLALMVAAPAMLFLAICIKFTSRGPIFFRHTRIGLGGQPFEMIKFRSMKAGTHQAVWSTESERLAFIGNDFKLSSSDHRITRIGRVLRRTSLDELPQFINVLKGDMSIVGVRPLVATELAMRPEIDQALYCRLRPGITGLWQTSGRSTVVHNERIAMDRAYTAVWHPMWDVEILLKTPKSLLRTDHAA